MVSTSAVRIGADGLLLAVFAAAAAISLRSLDSPTYWFPAFITIGGTLAAGYNLVADVVRVRGGHSLTDGEIVDIGASVTDTHDDAAEEDGTGSVGARALVLALWLVALPLLGLVVPFFYAALIWLVALLRFQAKQKWLFVVVSVAVFGIFLNVLIVLLEIRMPPAVLTGLG